MIQSIKGYYGCSCHSFSSWNECNQAHKRKFAAEEPVRNRCSGKTGVIYKNKGQGFYTIKYGSLPKDITLEHAAMLVPVLKENQLFLF